MQFESLNGGPLQDAEKVYAAVRNISGATMSAGAAAFFVVASPDGISVSNAGSTRKWGFAGILPTALSDSSYGRAQVYGICSAYMVLNSTSVSAVAGQQLDVSWFKRLPERLHGLGLLSVRCAVCGEPDS
jgi:hypothetical protein